MREKFHTKNKIAFAVHRHINLGHQLSEHLGLVENGAEDKLYYKHSAINKKIPHEAWCQYLMDLMMAEAKAESIGGIFDQSIKCLCRL